MREAVEEPQDVVEETEVSGFENGELLDQVVPGALINRKVNGE